MGNFGWAGAAAGGADSLEQILTRKLVEAQQREQLALQQQAGDRAERQLQATLAANEDARKRNSRDQQLQEGAIALGQAEAMGPGVELSPDVTRALTNTPYAARLEQKSTLPSRTIGATGINLSDAGGRAHTTLAPTVAQQREQEQRTALEAAATDPTLPPIVRRFVDLRRRGVNVPNPESLETPDERDARAAKAREQDFGDFTRRTDYQARVTADARRRALQDPVSPRDRVGAMRQADAAAADYLASIGGDYGVLPDGMDAETIRQQFIDEYLGALEQKPGQPTPGQTRRIIEGLSRIVPAPTRSGGTSRRMVGDLVPRGGAPSVVGPRPASGDPYEQYLARTGGR